MSKIKPWEKIPKSKKRPNGSYVTRLGDSGWGIYPYEYGYVIGKIMLTKVGCKFDTPTCKYPSDLAGVVHIISKLGTRIDGVVVDGLDEAVQGTIRANAIAVEASTKLREVLDAAA